MAGNLLVEIVTPESALWSGPATALIGRSSDGEFTILAQHTPIVGDIVPGVVRVETAEGVKSFAVHGGFFQVGPSDDHESTRATVLAGTAELTSSIDVARATAAKEQAEAVLSARAGEEADEDAQRAARADLARAELRLSAAS